MKESDFSAAPVAEAKPHYLEKFGTRRVDNYFWLKDKKDSAVLEYIKEEKAYTDSVMASTTALQEEIYREIVGRIKEDDESYPLLRNGYYYYSRTEKGKQYRVYCRKQGSLDADEEVIFDCNKMAEGSQAFLFADYRVSPDATKALYLYNETGSYAEFTMKVRDLRTGADVELAIDGVASVAWANDSDTFFYSTIDKTLRSSRIYRSALSSHNPEVVYEERDAKFHCYVYEEKSRQYVFISSASSTTSEEWFVSADTPKDAFRFFLPRVKDVEYSVYTHKSGFFIRYKDKQHLNALVYRCALDEHADKKAWKEFYPHSDAVLIEDLCMLERYLVLELREKGLITITTKALDDGATKSISFPEPVYSASLNVQPEYEATTFRYTYTSLNRPTTIYEYHIEQETSEKLKEQEVPSGFNPDDYCVERKWAQGKDGVSIPYALVYKKGLKKDGTNPALLYSYGSYGHSSDVYFSTAFYSLIDRGFVFAIAQIRGGSDLGEQWYEDGKLLHKKNTFDDFIACSEHFIAEGYTASSKLAIMGGSAGGLLMGAVANMRPDLFNAVVAQVPFVDVVTTMLDDTLPLTTGEYEEWGNPNEEEYFHYMLSYSPYDNIEAKDYPNMLVTGGLNDSQVLFHEPTKYTAKLRAHKTDNNMLLLHMNMESGHGGATGRYDRIKDIAFEFAFILATL